MGQDGLLERMLVALLAAGTSSSRECPAWPRPWRSRPSRRRSAASSSASSSPPTWCRPTSSARGSTTSARASSRSRSGRCSPTSCSPTRSTARPAKVQSALLEVMQERQVTIGRETYPAPDPFLVMATQNPIESEGTYALPEAQVDRFMLKVLVGYPTAGEEFVVVERMTGALEATQRVIDPSSSSGLPARGRRGLRRPGGHRVRRPARQRDPRAGRRRPARPRPLPLLRRQPAGVDQPGARRPRRSRSCAAGTTRCPPTPGTSPSTCCATGSCCPTRRSPTASPPTTCSAHPRRGRPLPDIPLRERAARPVTDPPWTTRPR